MQKNDSGSTVYKEITYNKKMVQLVDSSTQVINTLRSLTAVGSFYNIKFTNMKYKKNLNIKTNKNTKDSTFIIRQTLLMKLHNTFDVCRL